MGKKRLGIFLTYDPEGIVDAYIPRLLDDLSPLFSRLIIVCNGFLTPESRDILEKYSENIFVRENKGFDFRAWRDAMFEYYGYFRVREYDELVLFNDSFFGPLHPFSGVFAEMEKRGYDFWGLSVHGEAPTVRNLCPYGYRPRYIQTYFMVFNRRMLQDDAFIRFWEKIPVYTDFQQVSEKCAAVMTQYFSSCGYRWGVYSDTTDLEEEREKNICHHAYHTEELIARRQYPVIKRRSFVLGKKRFLQYNTGLDLTKALKYIREQGLYDTDLIFPHLLRRYDVAEIRESLNLSFVFDGRAAGPEEEELLSRTVVCIRIRERGSWERLLPCLRKLEKRVAVHVFAGPEAAAEISGSKEQGNIPGEIRITVFDGTWPECLIHALKLYGDRYEYMAFTHDPVFSGEDPAVVRETAREWLWDNLIPDADYLGQLLSGLKADHFLGMLTPPPPFHGRCYTRCVRSEGGWNARIASWNSALGDVAREAENPRILSAGGTFLCRTEALGNLRKVSSGEKIRELAREEENLDAFDHMMPYVAQKNGFLSGWCLSREYASTEIESARYMTGNMSLPGEENILSGDMSFPVILNGRRRYWDKLQKSEENSQAARMEAEKRIRSLEREVRQQKIQLELLQEYYNSLWPVRLYKGAHRLLQRLRPGEGKEDGSTDGSFMRQNQKESS